MIVPQLAFGGCTPMDRNDRADSVRMVVAIISGSSTITTDTTFGRMSENISRRFDAPWAIAASANSFLATVSTWPRTGRYTYGTKMTAMMRVGSHRLVGTICSGPILRPLDVVSS